ncbi:alpha/beta hydrolase family esterase [Paraburkholderia hospita]|uniref:extracellular catalytic domain type 1 short-chain-length polyhydroxyalkanoate depolymerase n=1 Tax=Paraburkholderia hospita TaxID=169430 RepID=UPI000B3485F3|nr:PHB depolymerase family esterase [Paraburkholderia hospita]OUL80298.1 esterase [Paraburkholderia hospita]
MNNSNPFLFAQDLTFALFIRGPVEATTSFFCGIIPEYASADPEPSHCDEQCADSPTRPSLPRAPAESVWLHKTFRGKAGARNYKVYVPTSYGREPLPMIVMLHGANQDPDDFATGTRMNILAEEARYIVVYPEQPQSANAARCWNWFRPGDQVRESGEAALIAELTREVMSTYNADSTRIYVAGMSAGGAMAVNLAVTHADLYAAAGIHSGIPYGTADDALSAMSVMNYGSTDFQFELLQKKSGQRAYTPLIAFHGDQDNVVHPRNCDELMRMNRIFALSQESTPSQVTTFAPEADGIYGHMRSLSCDDTGEVIGEQWIIHGLDHAWSGGDSAGSYTDCNGPDASREMLRFFDSVKLNTGEDREVSA